MKKVSLLFLIALMFTAVGAYASGLAIPEQGAAAMGMSAAMTARSEDLSALYYNPAGIDYVENSEILLGITPIMPRHKFESDTESENAEKMTFSPPNLYIAHRLHERVVFGFGMFTPYGLGTRWSEDWNGRYTSTYAEIRSIYITPALSVKLHDMLSFGISFSWVWSDAIIRRKIDSGLSIYSTTAQLDPASANPAMIANPNYDSEFCLKGDGGGVSYTFGLMLRPFERMQLGVTYTGESELLYRGIASFHNSAENLLHPKNFIDSLLVSQLPHTQNGEATLNLPSSINVGLKLDLTPAWDAELDLNFVNWSSYNELVIDLADDLPMDKLIQEKNWEDVMTIRLGTSYDIGEESVVRFGFLSDKAPIPDETFDAQLPDNDRIGLSLGFGRTVDMWGVPIGLDVSYMYLKFSDRDKENFVGYQDAGSLDAESGMPTSIKDGIIDSADKVILDTLMGSGDYPVSAGSYKSHVNLFSVSASYKF